MRILVAGATGLVGREVVQQLKRGGHWIRTLSRDKQRAASLVSQVDDVRIVDAASEPLHSLGDGIEVVVSALGAPVAPDAPSKQAYADIDIAANRALLEEAVRAKARRFVYVGVFTQPAFADTAYVRAHSTVEALVRATRLEYGFVRPTGIFGAFASFITLARKGPLPVVAGGEALTNPIHERDVALAVVRAVEAAHSSEADVGGPEVLSRRRIVELAFEAIGQRPRPLLIPAWVMRCIGFSYGLINPRAGDFLRFIASASTHDCVAPMVESTETLGAYFKRLA